MDSQKKVEYFLLKKKQKNKVEIHKEDSFEEYREKENRNSAQTDLCSDKSTTETVVWGEATLVFYMFL